MEETKVTPIQVNEYKFTQLEIDTADVYINSLGRNDLFPIRPAIGEAFIEGMRTASDKIINLGSRNKQLTEALEDCVFALRNCYEFEFQKYIDSAEKALNKRQ